MHPTQVLKMLLNKHVGDLTDCILQHLSLFWATFYGTKIQHIENWTHAHTSSVIPKHGMMFFRISTKCTWTIKEWHHGRKWVGVIVQMLPFSSAPCRSHPFGFPAVFPAGFSGFNSSSWRILSVKLWLHCLVLASQHSTPRIVDDSSLLDTAPRIFYQDHSFILAYR